MFQNYFHNKTLRKWMNVCYDLEFLKQEQQYLIDPSLNTIPILKQIITEHILRFKLFKTTRQFHNYYKIRKGEQDG